MFTNLNQRKVFMNLLERFGDFIHHFTSYLISFENAITDITSSLQSAIISISLYLTAYGSRHIDGQINKQALSFFLFNRVN